MRRIIDYHLLSWKNNPIHKPLLLRGARQVGKTHAVRVLGQTFGNFVEINLETNKKARAILEKDLDALAIISQLGELLQVRIEPGTTLLFLDEIQQVPQAIIALRYFYELMPNLHVIAAGSLLEFAIEQVGIPVGRVTTLYMYPLSFIEFLVATGNARWAETIVTHTHNTPYNEQVHDSLLSLVNLYCIIGGMPEAVNQWIRTKISRDVRVVHSDLIFSYQQDFSKYAKMHQIKYLELLLAKGLEQLSKKFMFSRVGEYKKRELTPALDLLEKSGLLYKIVHSAGQGIPLGAQANLDDFKIIFLDVGLTQELLNLGPTEWFNDPVQAMANKGEIIEAFVGQELLVYADPIAKKNLYYWHREVRSSSAELDYLVQMSEYVVPIEVKAGFNKRIVSMHMFLESHQKSSYGIRFWAGNCEHESAIYSYPLYAVIQPLLKDNDVLQNAVHSLLQ